MCGFFFSDFIICVILFCGQFRQTTQSPYHTFPFTSFLLLFFIWIYENLYCYSTFLILFLDNLFNYNNLD